MTARSRIQTPNAPAAIGPYSQAVLVGDTLYCSGQIPLDPSTMELVSGTIADETERVCQNLAAVLEAGGMDFSHVVSCNVYLSDMAHFAEMNGVYDRYFGASLPARATVAVAGLPKSVRVEIACVAVR
ncbi:MAG: RidA family protein [Rhodothermales bacterium]|nr:RidA family protein [Rhodothermales bacterium]